MSGGWGDFNDADDVLEEGPSSHDTQAIKQAVLSRLPDVLGYLFPRGNIKGTQFFVGDLDGNIGKSLVIELGGSKAGLWVDFATGESGDIFELWAVVAKLDCQHRFGELLDVITRWLGQPCERPSQRPSITPNVVLDDDLGAHTGKWDYQDREGRLIACVYRYDTPTGKEFRPWDVMNRKAKAPNPRPLYNQPAIAGANQVVLVEGEKCADALIGENLVATTAMNGANAPVDKTDWSPLVGKDVVIWPDNDKAGEEYALRVSAAISSQGVRSVSILRIPKDKPEKWDAADGVAEGVDIKAFISDQGVDMQPVGLVGIDPVSEWIGRPPKREWIIEDWLPKGYVTALYGDGGVGKTLLAQQLVTAIATGRPWMSLTIQRRKVYALMCEDDSDELWRRQDHINQAEGITMKHLTQVKMVSRVGMDNLLMTFDGQDSGALTPFFHMLLADILAFKAEVIVLDTAADLFGGNENNRTQVRQFIQNACARIARESAGAVLLSAHPSDSGISRGTGTGGSTAWSNTVRSRWYLTHVNSEDALPFERLLSRKKSNYSATKDDISLVWESGVLMRIYPDNTPIINHESQEAKVDVKKNRNKATIIALLRSEAKDKGKLYTTWEFAQVFKQHDGLGSVRSIKYLLKEMGEGQDLFFTVNGLQYGQKSVLKGHGYLCYPSMPITVTRKNEERGGIETVELFIKPTHRVDHETKELLPYEDVLPEVLPYVLPEVLPVNSVENSTKEPDDDAG